MEPKYVTIYHDMVTKIGQGIYKQRTKLPSENDLMTVYDVSRATIRKALNLLEQNGYIQKIQGKGSFVLDIHKFDFPVSGLVSFKELSKKMGMKAKTLVEALEIIKPDDELMKRLHITSQDEVWQVIRVREIDGTRVILDKDYFNKVFVPGLTKEICEHSIYDYLENDLGIKISFAKKEITVQQATEEDRQYLNLEGYDMVVVVKNYIYLEDASLFQYTESRHRPDKFKFVDFARRSH